MDTEQRASSQAEEGEAPRPGGVARYTRKGLLGRAGGAAAGITAGSLLGVANAEAARVIPRRRLAPTQVTVMWNEGELPKADIEAFEAQHPNIKIDFIADDPAKLAAMIASGNPPEVWRVQGPAIPSLLRRRLIRPLTTYFQQSDILRPGDLAPANNYYKSNGRQVGVGQIYGMVKDWSPDFNIFINRDVFRAANVPVPSAAERLTYAEAKSIAARLTRRRRGGRPVNRGFAHSSDLNWFDRTVMNMIAERGKSLYANNFTRMNLTKNAEARKVFQFFFDMHKRKLDVNPLLPSSSWDGVDFTAGKIGMIQYGYWFGGMAESKVTKGKVVMLPAPTWGRVPRNPTITATGGVISSRTQNADAAWEFFEFYMGGKPARDRAASGWGVPALKSMYDRIPNKTAFDKQRRRVLQKELALSTKPIQFNPYLSDVAVATAYKKHVEQALRGRISFSQMLERIEREVNGLIDSGRRG